MGGRNDSKSQGRGRICPELQVNPGSAQRTMKVDEHIKWGKLVILWGSKKKKIQKSTWGRVATLRRSSSVYGGHKMQKGPKSVFLT